MPRGRPSNSDLEKLLYANLTPEEKIKYDKEKRRKKLEEARDQRKTQNVLIAICLVIAFATIAFIAYCGFKYGK